MGLQRLRELTEQLEKEAPIIEEFFQSPEIGTAVFNKDRLVASNELGERARLELIKIIKAGCTRELFFEGDYYLVSFFSMGNLTGAIMTKLMGQAVIV